MYFSNSVNHTASHIPFHIISDILTTLAYFSIPIALLIFVRKRKDLQFRWMFVCFVAFIMLCGASHLMHVVLYFIPTPTNYIIDWAVRGLTAAVSLITAVLLWWLIPKALSLPSPSELKQTNKALNKSTEELHKTNELLMQEIVKHKETAKELKHLTMVMESSNDAIIGVTLEGKISSWNLGAREIFNYSDEEIVGEHYISLVHQDSIEEMTQILNDTKDGLKSVNQEIKHIRRDHSIIEGSLTVSPIRNKVSEDIIGISVIVRDVTELKKLHEEMNRLSQLHIVGELAASVAHEIRNPMTVIRGFVQLYSKEMGKINKAHGEIIIDELDRTQSIIDSYLSLAKPQKEKTEEIHIKDALLQMMEVMVSYANYQKVEIEYNIEDGLVVYANREKFSQMLINVMKNGIEAMPDGGTLTINSYCHDGIILIDIIDSGVGMTEEEIKRLGSPFYSTKEKGTGLGTMVMYKILATFGWKLKVTSEKGKGSCFRFIVNGEASSS